MPDKVVNVHHSVTDWDFEKGPECRTLDPSKYISAPTSLSMWGSAPLYYNTALCRIAGTLCLPQGEVRTWNYQVSATIRNINFRNQKPLGSANRSDCYYCLFYSNKVFLRTFQSGVSFIVGDTPFPTLLNQWVHYRVAWYNGTTPGEVPALCTDFYREVAGEWLKEGDTIYDPYNLWKDSLVNRCGLLATGISVRTKYFDDTEIWGPV